MPDKFIFDIIKSTALISISISCHDIALNLHHMGKKQKSPEAHDWDEYQGKNWHTHTTLLLLNITLLNATYFTYFHFYYKWLIISPMMSAHCRALWAPERGAKAIPIVILISARSRSICAAFMVNFLDLGRSQYFNDIYSYTKESNNMNLNIVCKCENRNNFIFILLQNRWFKWSANGCPRANRDTPGSWLDPSLINRRRRWYCDSWLNSSWDTTDESCCVSA